MTDDDEHRESRTGSKAGGGNTKEGEAASGIEFFAATSGKAPAADPAEANVGLTCQICVGTCGCRLLLGFDDAPDGGQPGPAVRASGGKALDEERDISLGADGLADLWLGGTRQE